MRCPICGSKMVSKQLCKYCGVTDEQVYAASNKKVKEYRKSGNVDMIHYTTVLPSDIVRWKLVVYTIVLGWLGINYYYINRPVRGSYSLVSTIGCLSITIIGLLTDLSTKSIRITYNIFYELFNYMMAINVVLWVLDLVAVIFKRFKVPVVLPKKEDIKRG